MHHFGALDFVRLAEFAEHSASLVYHVGFTPSLPIRTDIGFWELLTFLLKLEQ